jgi:hypothetical protein
VRRQQVLRLQVRPERLRVAQPVRVVRPAVLEVRDQVTADQSQPLTLNMKSMNFVAGVAVMV